MDRASFQTSMSRSIKLSVIIATYNRRQILARTLPTLFRQNLSPDEYEVIVVVDGSSDGTLEHLRPLKPSCAFRVIEQPNRGKVAARNAGLAVALGPLVLFLDDDIVCDPANLSAHVAAHGDGESLVVHGPVFVSLESPDTLPTEWVRGVVEEETRRWRAGLRSPNDASVDANYSVPRSALLACGGFDETFAQAKENGDLGLCLWERGLRFHYEPKAVAWQVYVKTAAELVRKQAWWWGRNEIHLCRKHQNRRPHSSLATLADGSPWKKISRESVARFPLSPDAFLYLPFGVAEKLRSIPGVRRLGVRLLTKRISVSFLRGALLEAGSWQALQREFGRKLPVLLYHHVGPRRPGTSVPLTVSPGKFERQVRWLARRGYVGIRPSDWLRWRREGTGLPDKPVLLTFDDAYADVAEYALPVLQRHGFGAAVFVVTGQVGGTNRWDEVRGSGTHRVMTAEQIRCWAGRGIEFGAHSRTHPDLTTLGATELAEEVAGSGKELASITGVRTGSFAYPYGPYNQAVCDCVRGVFDLAFTTDEGLNTLRTDPHLLRRAMVLPSDSLADLECRLRWGWSPLQRFRARVRLRTRLKRASRLVFGASQ